MEERCDLPALPSVSVAPPAVLPTVSVAPPRTPFWRESVWPRLRDETKTRMDGTGGVYLLLCP